MRRQLSGLELTDVEADAAFSREDEERMRAELARERLGSAGDDGE